MQYIIVVESVDLPLVQNALRKEAKKHKGNFQWGRISKTFKLEEN